MKSYHGPPAVRIKAIQNLVADDKVDIHYIEYDSTYNLETIDNYTDYIDGTKRNDVTKTVNNVQITRNNNPKGIFYDTTRFLGGELPWVQNVLNPTAAVND